MPMDKQPLNQQQDRSQVHGTTAGEMPDAGAASQAPKQADLDIE